MKYILALDLPQILQAQKYKTNDHITNTSHCLVFLDLQNPRKAHCRNIIDLVILTLSISSSSYEVMATSINFNHNDVPQNQPPTTTTETILVSIKVQ